MDLGTGSGVLAIAAAKLGWGPVSGYDHEQAALEAAAANADVNGISLELDRADLRRGLPDLGPTTVANLTAPVLLAVAAQMPPAAPPSTLICSGLLPSECDEVAEAFAAVGLRESERRADGDWSALLLRRAG